MFFKKGQLQVQETILVVFILIVIIILGMVVFTRFTEQGIENEAIENRRLRFNTLLSSFPETPEIECSITGLKESCIDVYKLSILGALTNVDKSYYRGRFGEKNITVYLVYPEENKNFCKINNLDNCGVWNVYYWRPEAVKGGRVIIQETPVSLYFPRTDSYGVGRLVIEGYGL